MANTFREVYKKTGANSYQLVGNVGVGGIKLDIMKGASSSSVGEIGLVPKPLAGQENHILTGGGSFSNIRNILNNEEYGEFTEDLTGTGCYVHYNEQLVIIVVNANGVFTNNARTNKLVLPSSIIGNTNTLFQSITVLNEYWFPINNVAFVDFSNKPQDSTKYRNAYIKLMSATSLKINIVGTMVFPRKFFLIGDEIQ